MKSLTYYFHKKTKILAAFHICISVPLILKLAIDYYTWIFTSRIFRIALEITFLLNKYFFLRNYFNKVENLVNGKRSAGANNSGGWRGIGEGGWKIV